MKVLLTLFIGALSGCTKNSPEAHKAISVPLEGNTYLTGKNTEFSADETALKQSRMDYKEGEENGKFYMQHCGFFNDYPPTSKSFSRPDTNKFPTINFAELPAEIMNPQF
jgi:hypothetical protein